MADLLETETALNEWRAHWPACKGVPETPEATPTDFEHEHRQLRLHFFEKLVNYSILNSNVMSCS